ncbi:hypothetical protein H8356DRAFT_1417181 [Neocallimastix lanati (nom. inval.)]|nr:hypothetical protein H8356DRAFT_1417181 [Neocallimastix sp. JGI-2020a]
MNKRSNSNVTEMTDERNLPNTFKKKKANHIHHLQYLKELKNKRCNNQVISNSISVINSKNKDEEFSVFYEYRKFFLYKRRSLTQ